MDSRRSIWRWALAGLGAIALGAAAHELTSDGPDAPAAQELPPTAQELSAEPSALARRAIPARALEAYIQVGEELGLDWAVLAAVDQTEGGSSPAEESERIAAIGYTLQAFGAPDEYRAALAANGGERRAASVLRLAERYRSFGASEPPSAEGRLVLPAEGPVIAAFGRRLGILHDGIDIDAPSGEPVRAAAPGLVLSTGFHSIFGEQTCVLHELVDRPAREREITTCYGNQSAYEVKPGDVVGRGETIGRVGCTGSCVRPHVHFQVRLGVGSAAPVTDPAPFLELSPSALPRGRPLEGS